MDLIYCDDLEKCNPPRHHDRHAHTHGTVTVSRANEDAKRANDPRQRARHRAGVAPLTVAPPSDA